MNRLMAENERHGSTTTTMIVATTTQPRTQHEATSATFGQRVKKAVPPRDWRKAQRKKN
ncbi:hypothetical protein KL954_04015 [Neptunomonas phycophila]|nr:hypothetical protein [Neptunomonas phycophila]